MSIDCKKICEIWQEEIKEKLNKLNKIPHLVVILVGNDPASISYVKGKEKDCAKINVKSTTIRLNDTIKESELLELIDKLNADDDVNGILVQLPLPKHIKTSNVINRISYLKDVDGFHLINLANLALNLECTIPCTPKGIMKVFEYYHYDLTSKNVVVIGRSNIVGKPMSYLLTNKNATVTLCHSKTINLKFYTKHADVIIVAIGKPKFLKKEMIKKNAFLIDVGINRVNDKLIGDIDYIECITKTPYITPVPKGIGLLTRTALLDNLINITKKG